MLTIRARTGVLAALLLALSGVSCTSPDAGGEVEVDSATTAGESSAPSASPDTTGWRTRVVMLGTGTPNADPERSGPAVAIVVDDRAYIVDAGPGVVRRAAQAARDLDIPALRAGRLDRVFISHLHSDHTLGLPDLMLSPWVLDRPGPLHVTGPPGIRSMMESIEAAWSADVDKRINGLEPRGANRDSWRPVVSETTGGLVYEDDVLRIEAIPVTHGDWDHAYGYRFIGPDRTIVVSGDASPSESIVEACNGCDLLVHEIYSGERLLTRPPAWQAYHSVFHTSPEQLVDIATRAGAQTLVLYHQLYWGTDDAGIIAEMRAAGWDGPLESARDLGVY